jgi:hypothetical protein
MNLRRTPLTAIVTAALSAVLLTVATTAGTAAAQPAAEPAAAQSAAAQSAAQPAASATRASVPWSHVGAGWVLTQYTSAPVQGSGPEALYLISPGGTRYQLASWSSTKSAPQLIAWSPDGRRALFQVFSGKGGVEVLTLATGQVSTFVMPGSASPIGFTTPHGLNILAGQPSGNGTSLARYDLSGRLAQRLGYSADGQVLYAPSGTEFATGTSNGVKLVSNGGTLIRNLPVSGMSADSCNPVRWWNGGTILVSCLPPNTAVTQLWLVPVSGARPTPLTPKRSASSGDLGDLDAWPLPSGLYLQASGPCAVLQIFKQSSSGSITLVTVPHTNGDNHVLTALGSRLLVQAPTSCEGSNSLLWFNPATQAEQWLIRAPGNVTGVASAIPFYSREDGNL